MSDQAVDYRQVWQEALGTLDQLGMPPSRRALVGLCRLVGVLDQTAVIKVPNSFTRDFIAERFRAEVTQALSNALGEPIQIAVTIDETIQADPEAGTRRAPGATTAASSATAATGSGRTAGHTSVTTSTLDTNDIAVPGSDPSDADFTHAQNGSAALRDLAALPPHAGGDDPADPTDPADPASPANPGPSERSRPAGRPGATNVIALPSAGDQSAASDTRLNPKYTFDTFVIGSSNRFAHAAAVAVAEAPARAYNPLFIYGESGLGKTHLLHAIGHYARTMFPGVRVRYVNSEEFTNDFINSIRDDKASAFQSRYRNVDVLLIDDIQFLQGKLQTQEEFFHTFNALHNAEKQIVITSDLPPKELSGFEDRMRTRFESGLLTDVQPPDLETRIAVLRKKLIRDRTDMPGDVMEYIATHFSTNIRELEGAFIRVAAFASLNQRQVDMALAEEVLKDVIPSAAVPQVTAQAIMSVTAKYYEVTLDDLCSSSRSQPLTLARQIAMYLCRELTDMSFPQISKEFGNRDHTTVMHANKKIRGMLATEHAIYKQVTELTNRLRHQTHP